VSGYLDVPAGWERVSAEGPGPFVTSELIRAPDGHEVRWRSRAHRKAHRANAGDGLEPTWWRPRRASWWMAVLFALGSLCFALAALASQWASSSRSWIGATFFLGSLLFTAAAYLQYSEAVNVEHRLTAHERRSRWRPASWEPSRIDWLAASVQLLGTVFFNISTFAALKHGLDAHEVNARVWGPDVFGSACFLISSELAFAEVCHRWIGVRRDSLPWRIVALNLLGSIAFGVAAVASLVEPASGEEISARIANGGTSLGGVCFLIAALALMPEASAQERAAPAAEAVVETVTAPAPR
jgi:YrhK-like protein